MPLRQRPWTNGEPYYCAVCGLGMPEYMACELPDCKLETKAEAMKRFVKEPPALKNQPYLIGRRLRDEQD